MGVSSALFARLVDDASMFPPGNAGLADALAGHLRFRQSWFAPMIGPLVVRDTDLVRLGQAVRAEGADPVAVSVINSGGAGGLLALARRDADGVAVVAVESALRDLDDLAGNAARVAAAAGALDEDVTVFVEFPFAAGWERAVEEIEAAGLSGKIRTGGPDPGDTPSADQVARQLGVLIDADLPFKATAGLHHAWASIGQSAGAAPRQHGFLNVLLAVEALIEGASPAEAVDLLVSTDHPELLDGIVGWAEADVARIRRRFRSFGCCGVEDPVGDLVALGLVGEAA